MAGKALSLLFHSNAFLSSLAFHKFVTPAWMPGLKLAGEAHSEKLGGIMFFTSDSPLFSKTSPLPIAF